MTASRPPDLDQYGVILYTAMWQSGMTIMPMGYKDITPDPDAQPRPVQSAMLTPSRRVRHALSVLFTGKAQIQEDELG